MKDIRITGEDQLNLYVAIWDEVTDPKAVIQLSHGMAEHITRYEGFAQFLNEQGFIVVGHDHRGHGYTANTQEDIGYFSDAEGWLKLVTDLKTVTQYIRQSYDNLPVILFGHSMGSFAVRHYLGLFGSSIDGAIICGTGQNPRWLNLIAQKIARYEMKKYGPRHRSTLLTQMSFGSFNNKFKPNKTQFDWLSRDEVEVFKYIEDEFCGAVFTASFFNDFLSGLLELDMPTMLDKIPKTLPCYFISGEMDPLSGKGQTVQRVADTFKRHGVADVTVKIYPEARHELTNEINRLDVYQDVVNWILPKIQS